MSFHFFALCMQNEHDAVRKLLMENEEIVNQRFHNDETALHIAASENYIELFLVLQKQKSDINSKDLFKNTPLMKASEKGYINIVKLLLLEENIAVNEQNICGNTALMLGD